jgi:hypothetical protein
MRVASMVYLDFLDAHGGYYTATVYIHFHSFFAIQSRMMVRRYFYVDIDPIARQVAASRMREFTTRFPQ